MRHHGRNALSLALRRPADRCVPDREPNAEALTGARQLLTLGRRLGWTVAHTRRRAHRQPVIRARGGGFANRAQSADVGTGLLPRAALDRGFAGASALLHSWRDETVLVAAFDPVALLSCLLACYEPGPRLVLVEDVTSLQELGEAAPVSAFHRRRLEAGLWRDHAGRTAGAGKEAGRSPLPDSCRRACPGVVGA